MITTSTGAGFVLSAVGSGFHGEWLVLQFQFFWGDYESDGEDVLDGTLAPFHAPNLETMK